MKFDKYQKKNVKKVLYSIQYDICLYSYQTETTTRMLDVVEIIYFSA